MCHPPPAAGSPSRCSLWGQGGGKTAAVGSANQLGMMSVAAGYDVACLRTPAQPVCLGSLKGCAWHTVPHCDPCRGGLCSGDTSLCVVRPAMPRIGRLCNRCTAALCVMAAMSKALLVAEPVVLLSGSSKARPCWPAPVTTCCLVGEKERLVPLPPVSRQLARRCLLAGCAACAGRCFPAAGPACAGWEPSAQLVLLDAEQLHALCPVCQIAAPLASAAGPATARQLLLLFRIRPAAAPPCAAWRPGTPGGAAASPLLGLRSAFRAFCAQRFPAGLEQPHDAPPSMPQRSSSTGACCRPGRYNAAVRTCRSG